MGCFNHKGNLSNLPIEGGDDIIVLVGIRERELDHFSLGFSFTPITLPIYGKYNEYGGIMNVIKTPCTDFIENFFGISAEVLVDTAERCDSGCDDDVMEYLNIIHDKIKPFLEGLTDFTIGYFMEHASVFKKMVETGNMTLASIHRDGYDWRDEFLYEIGYTPTQNSNYTNNIKWEHSELPALVDVGHYFHLVSDFFNTSTYPSCINDFCKLIGCEVPEKYNKSFFEDEFEKSMKFKYPTNVSDYYDIKYCYFINHHYACGFFHHNEYDRRDFFALPFDTLNGGHLKDEYKQEFVEFASFIKSMRIMNMTWGVSNYYSQCCKYDYHKEFLNSCMNVIDDKIKNNEE